MTDTEKHKNQTLLEAATQLGIEAQRRGAEEAIPAPKKPASSRRDLSSGIRVAPHIFERSTVRALLCGPDMDEALMWIDRHKDNPSFLEHALSLEQGRMRQRVKVIEAIKDARRAYEIAHFGGEIKHS